MKLGLVQSIYEHYRLEYIVFDEGTLPQDVFMYTPC